MSINYNLEEIASYVVLLNGKTLSIRPEIKIEAFEGKAKGGEKANLMKLKSSRFSISCVNSIL